MVIRELLQKGIAALRETCSTAPQLDAAVLLCHVLGKDRLYLTVNASLPVAPDTEADYVALLKQCAEGTPVSYLTGKREFMSLEFEVSPAVLIPRPDTETLCEWVINRCKGKELDILDLCCGSGCIGISLAVYLPKSRVTLVDISCDALTIARQNAARLGVDDRVEFLCRDVMHESIVGCWDVLASNPPYIESGEIDRLARGVREYEPRLALDGGTDGLDFYRRLAQIASGLLNQNGILAMEVGRGQAGAVKKLLETDFSRIGTVCDLAAVARVVTAEKV